MTPGLAIVIPAYKSQYFRAALQSLARQTNKNFKVYISDDASPADLKAIATEFMSELDIVYYRFDENIGGDNLVGHWNRSVRLANEEWIWMFSDDDVMTPGCVDAFYKALDKTKETYDLYRFDIEMIDANDKVVCVKKKHPQLEVAYQFATRRLASESLSAAIEYIFKKEVFEKHKGFVNFPLAFCSDDASWIAFANDKPIYTIESPSIYWRVSGINISSVRGLQKFKAQAMLDYCFWLKNQFSNMPEAIIEKWFFENLKYVYGKIGLHQKFSIAKMLSRNNKGNFFYYLSKIIYTR